MLIVLFECFYDWMYSNLTCKAAWDYLEKDLRSYALEFWLWRSRHVQLKEVWVVVICLVCFRSLRHLSLHEDKTDEYVWLSMCDASLCSTLRYFINTGWVSSSLCIWIQSFWNIEVSLLDYAICVLFIFCSSNELSITVYLSCCSLHVRKTDVIKMKMNADS